MLLKKSNFFTFKRLHLGKNRTSGRNSSGKITSYRRGAGCKRAYRIIDFTRYLWNIPAIPLLNDYDPNRSSPISLLIYSSGAISYILAPCDIQIAYPITSNVIDERFINRLKSGSASFINLFKPGSYLNSLETRPLLGAKYSRAGGGFVKLVSTLESSYVIVKLKSRFLLRISSRNIATLGILGCWKHTLGLQNKAGHSRLLGIRPFVRGVAKNPIDHPHGGGQGKTSGGRTSVTPWAFITKGRKTRKKFRYDKTIVKRS